MLIPGDTYFGLFARVCGTKFKMQNCCSAADGERAPFTARTGEIDLPISPFVSLSKVHIFACNKIIYLFQLMADAFLMRERRFDTHVEVEFVLGWSHIHDGIIRNYTEHRTIHNCNCVAFLAPDSRRK